MNDQTCQYLIELQSKNVAAVGKWWELAKAALGFGVQPVEHPYPFASDQFAAFNVTCLSLRATGVGKRGGSLHREVWLVGGVIAIGTVIGYAVYKEADWHSYRAIVRTWITQRFGVRKNAGVRNDFQQSFKMAEKKSPAGHSHPKSAAVRTAATGCIDDWILRTGCETYAVSASTRDEETTGYHEFYMARDVICAPQWKSVEETHIIKMVDVDYHVDMRRWIQYMRPLVLYTFSPVTVAGTLEEAHFTIENNTVDYFCKGGAHYHHRIWDFNSDWIVVDYYWGSIVCSIEQRHLSEQRRVVLITPEYKIWGPLGRWLPGKRLDYIEYEKNPGVNQIDSTNEDGERITSVGIPGDFTSVQLTHQHLGAIRYRCGRSKDPDPHSIERFLTKFKDQYPEPAITATHLLKIVLAMPVVVRRADLNAKSGNVEYRPDSFQAVGSEKAGFFVLEDGKEIGRCVHPSLVDHPGVVPRESYNNDLACIVGRIERVYNDKTPPPIYNRWAADFIRHLVPKPGIGTPWSIDQVIKAQNKPTQIGRNKRVMPWITEEDECFISAFMKHEAYGAVNSPRNISQCPTQHTLRLSAFTYPFKIDVMQDQPWFSPGKPPRKIAERLHEAAQRFEVMSEIDYSRFDGSISLWLRETVERAVMLRWCHPDSRRELASMIDAESNARGKTRSGLPYRSAFTRLSGSPGTTLWNSIVNAFAIYAAARKAGLTHEGAIDMIIAAAGDDGGTALAKNCMEAAAKDLGLHLKCEEKRSGDCFRYLGRVFLDPSSTTASIQDPVRTLKKLHISFAPKDVPLDIALYNRAYGYGALDPHAPLVSTWCQRVMKDVENRRPQILQDIKDWSLQTGTDLPYYIAIQELSGTGTWPQPGLDDDLAVQRVAEDLGVDSIQVRAWDELLRSGTLEEISGMIRVPDEQKIDAVVTDGDELRVVGDGIQPEDRVKLPSPRVLLERQKIARAAVKKTARTKQWRAQRKD
jgi:hypothetical protein